MANRGGTRLLIATGETATSEDELPRLVRALIDGASEVLVMTPVLVSRLQWLASDTDRARYEADERLSSLLGQVDTLAPEATVRGRIGDDTPLTAFSDAIREFSPDHILIALRSDHSGWQERGLLDEIRGFGIPITVFELDRTGRSPIRT
jgi:Bacterial toxin ydaT